MAWAHTQLDTAPDARQERGIQAILDGLSSRPESLGKGYYIQTSGAALIWDAPDGSKLGTKIWDDIEDIEAFSPFLTKRFIVLLTRQQPMSPPFK